MIFYLSLTLLAFASFHEAAISPAGCGLRPIASTNTKIVGGSLATEGDWSWSVSLTVGGQHFCGGVLIDDQHVLTAAHCFAGNQSPPRGTKVTVGVHNIAKKESWSVTRDIAKTFVHQNFSMASTVVDDIALIRLASPVTLDQKYIVPACLDESATLDPTGQETWLTGWGSQYFGGQATTLKYQLSNIIFPQGQCQAFYDYLFDPKIQICGGDAQQQEGNGACQGDSGGPLVYKNPADNKWYIVGLISWGLGCGYGTVYTKVASYIQWIQEKIAIQ